LIGFILVSWFEFDGTVISWLTSYLSSRSFVVSINSTFSATSPLRQGVPKGSVLGPLLVILNTTPLSSLISDSSVGHNLSADDIHWLSYPERIAYRLAVLAFRCLHSLAPSYLSEELAVRLTSTLDDGYDRHRRQ